MSIFKQKYVTGPTLNGLIPSISKFYGGATISFEERKNYWEVHNLNGIIKSVMVRRIGKRFVFGSILERK